MTKTSKESHRKRKGAHIANGSASKKRLLLKVAPSSAANDPIVCAFPSGLPPSLAQQRQQHSAKADVTTTHDSPKFVWLQKRQTHSETAKNGNSNNNATTTTTLLGKDEGCLYQADWSESQHAGRSRMFIGLYDKQKNTLTLHSTAGAGSVWALQQSVPSYQTRVSATTTAFDVATAAENRRALFEDFGSSKKQRALRSQEANRVHVKQVVGSEGMATVFGQGTNMSESNRKAVEEQRHLDQQQQQTQSAIESNASTAAVVSVTAVEAATQEWRRGFLPKYNANTRDPYKIYDPKDMAGSDEAWGQVCRVVDACYQKEDVLSALVRPPAEGDMDGAEARAPQDDWRNPSIRALLDTIIAAGSSSSKQRKNRLRCALLLNHFCNLYNKWHRKRFIPAPPENRSRYAGVPIAVVEAFLHQFATQVTDRNHQDFGYCMSKARKDKCQVYMLVLFLLAESGTNNTVQSDRFKSLADDLRLDASEASHLLRQAGCTVQRNNRTGVVSAVLQAPIVFPATKKRGGGGRR